MLHQIFQILDQIGFFLICFIFPGILFILNGIHVIKTKRTISVGRDSHFRWKKPVMIKGEQAVGDGRCGLIFGLGLFLLGLITIIGILN